MALISRIKVWSDDEDVTASDLNDEFDNILDNLIPTLIEDFSANASQMKSTVDPGEVGTESLATTLAGELQRLRFIIAEITGEDEWYESPSTSLAGLANAIGTGLTDNRLVSGRTRSDSEQPLFLVPNGAARTVKLDGTPTQFIYFIEGIQYTVSTDITITNLTAAPASNNTCLINDANAADNYWTKYAGEDGSEIPVDNMGTEITALVGKFAGFKLNNGSADEYFTAYVDSSTRLTKARRGYFFDSTDTPVPRIFYSNNDTITLMKLTWVFAKTDGTLTVTYTNPVWSDDEPTSPAANDYWFDISANKWMKYDVASFVDADAILIGICMQDSSNTVAARSFEFFANYDDLNTIEVIANSNTEVKSRFPGAAINVFGETIKFDQNITTWDITLDRESGVSESSSTYYYFYITQTGDKVISDKKPHDRREDLQGYYHPHHSWRCVGWALNNGSSNLEQVESYFHRRQSEVIRSVSAADMLLTRDRVLVLSGTSFTENLPPAALCKGNIYTFVHSGTSLSQIYTIDGFASETIGGATTVKMHTNGQTLKIISDGTNWLILDSKTITQWETYAPTYSSAFGTTADSSVRWRRVGTSMDIRGSWTGGTIAAAVATFTLPTGCSFSSTLVDDQKNTYGTAHWSNTTQSNIPDSGRGPVALVYDSADGTLVYFSFIVDSDDIIFRTSTLLNAVAGTTGTKFTIDMSGIPITDWIP